MQFGLKCFLCALLLVDVIRPSNATEKQVKISVHGNAFVASNRLQLTVDGTRYASWGVSYVAPAGTKMWFHAPIPVTNNLDECLYATKLSVLYKSKNSMITDILVWDGALQLDAIKSLSLQGDHSVTLSALNQFPVRSNYPIGAGLGVSVAVVFGNDGSEGGKPIGEMIFTGAGVTYNVEPSIDKTAAPAHSQSTCSGTKATG